MSMPEVFPRFPRTAASITTTSPTSTRSLIPLTFPRAAKTSPSCLSCLVGSLVSLPLSSSCCSSLVSVGVDSLSCSSLNALDLRRSSLTRGTIRTNVSRTMCGAAVAEIVLENAVPKRATLSRTIKYIVPQRYANFQNLEAEPKALALLGSNCRAADTQQIDACVKGFLLEILISVSTKRRNTSGAQWRPDVSQDMLEVIAEIQHGADVEAILTPWVNKLSPEEWNKLVNRVAENDCVLALQAFRVLKTQSALAPVTPASTGEETDCLRSKEIMTRWLKAYTTLAAVLARHGREDEVEVLVGEMKQAGVEPDIFLFNSLVRGYASQGLVLHASRVLLQMEKHGIQPNSVTYDRVIAAYLGVEEPQVDKAVQLLRGLRSSKCTVHYKTLSELIKACWLADRVKDADEVFSDMQAAGYVPDIKDWIKMMQLHGRNGNCKVVEALFHKSREAGLVASGGIYDALLLGYCRAGLSDQALSVFREYKLNMKPSLVAYNMAIDASGKSGRHKEAVKLYVELIDAGYRPSTVTYTSLISAVVQGGRYEKAEELYERMLRDKVSPSLHTYATMIHAYSLRGWTKVGHEVYLTAMATIGDVANDIIYGAVLDLYVRGRWYSHAADVLQDMETKGVEPDRSGYGVVISACRELDNEAFSPLAKAMQNSKFEPLSVAYQLVFSPPAGDSLVTMHEAGNDPTPIQDARDSQDDVEGSNALEHDRVVEDVTAFFESFATTRDRETNASLYSALLDVLWRRRLRRRAKSVMLKARGLLEWYNRPHFGETVWSLDLRGTSVGAAQVALVHWLGEVVVRAETRTVTPSKLILITGGRGKDGGNPTPDYVGRGQGNGAVKQAIEATLKDIGAPFVDASASSGPVQLQAQTEDVLRWVVAHEDLIKLVDS